MQEDDVGRHWFVAGEPDEIANFDVAPSHGDPFDTLILFVGNRSGLSRRVCHERIPFRPFGDWLQLSRVFILSSQHSCEVGVFNLIEAMTSVIVVALLCYGKADEEQEWKNGRV